MAHTPAHREKPPIFHRNPVREHRPAQLASIGHPWVSLWAGMEDGVGRHVEDVDHRDGALAFSLRWFLFFLAESERVHEVRRGLWPVSHTYSQLHAVGASVVYLARDGVVQLGVTNRPPWGAFGPTSLEVLGPRPTRSRRAPMASDVGGALTAGTRSEPDFLSARSMGIFAARA